MTFVLQVYKQKVKHLLYEHQNNISTLKADAELGLKLAGEEAAKREGELQKDCRTLKLELKEQVPFPSLHLRSFPFTDLSWCGHVCMIWQIRR